VRLDRGRTKKLILAFHFQFSDQAGWKCESCRKAGLEKKRRCGFVPGTEDIPERAVWSRQRVVATSCPKSLIAAESMAWIEEYCAWKLAGGGDYRTLSARQLDAFWTLEQATRAERNGSHE
jgi:hypothetical protein